MNATMLGLLLAVLCLCLGLAVLVLFTLALVRVGLKAAIKIVFPDHEEGGKANEADS